MSDLMLLGVLRMPMDNASPLDVFQYVARGRQAADEIDRLTAERDAAFALSRCQCGTDEACAELAKLRAAIAEALRMMGNWPEGAEAVLQDALAARKVD